jgi:DNA-binding NarL/FixJ family response regulator
VTTTKHGGDRPPTRICLYAEDQLRREVLGAYLETLPAVTLVGRVAHYADIVPLCAIQRPTIMLLDMCSKDVAEATAVCRELRERDGHLGLVLTYGRLSPADADAVWDTVDVVVPRMNGLAALAPVLDRLALRLPKPPPVSQVLTDRQLEVLHLLAAGCSAGEIAKNLGISVATVEYHKRRVYAKLSASTAVQAVAHAVAYGVIDRQAADRIAGGGGPTPRARTGTAGPPDARPPEPVVVVGDERDAVDRVVRTPVDPAHDDRRTGRRPWPSSLRTPVRSVNPVCHRSAGCLVWPVAGSRWKPGRPRRTSSMPRYTTGAGSASGPASTALVNGSWDGGSGHRVGPPRCAQTRPGRQRARPAAARSAVPWPPPPAYRGPDPPSRPRSAHTPLRRRHPRCRRRQHRHPYKSFPAVLSGLHLSSRKHLASPAT